ncbi:unnamed protein product, partial [Durusdinium trenchii]
QADRKFTEDWPGGAPQVEVTAGWLPRLQQRLHAARSRLRERRADALLYALVDLCADELVAVTRAFFARLTWLEEDLRIRGDRSLLDLGEVSLAQLQLAIVARRLRSLQRVVRRASEYQEPNGRQEHLHHPAGRSSVKAGPNDLQAGPIRFVACSCTW